MASYSWLHWYISYVNGFPDEAGLSERNKQAVTLIRARCPFPASCATELEAHGTTVEVHYDGTLLATGARFDSSRERGKTFKFTLGEGKVIGGWEVGVASMKPGERSVLTCSPSYAYGDKGIPPIIPPASALQFEVELLSVQVTC